MANDMLLEHLLKNSGNQMLQTFNGLSDSHFDFRLNEHTMTPRETAEHLCDCYSAAIAAAEGKEHAWGNYKLAASNPSEALAELEDLRDKAVAVASRESAVDYIALHDAYHAGQMVSLRLTVEPGWNAYAIYEELE